MKKSLSLFLLLAAFSAQAYAEELSFKNLAEELVKIRQQIENFHSQISYEKQNYQDQMRAYASQKADLGVKISRAELNNKDLQRELDKLSEINKKNSQAYEEIAPIIKGSIVSIRNQIKLSLPFKLKERLQALSDIEHRFKSGIITPNKAANQLWAYIEDELMLGRSSGLYNDTLAIMGEQKLVKVLRIGKIAMFYRTAEQQYGSIVNKDQKWIEKSYKDETSIAQLETLFDGFAKNIRNGQYSLPNILPEQGEL